MNGGICVDGVNTYNCQCPPEWTGTSYDKYFKFIMYITISVFELTCHFTSSGQYCAEDVNECLMQPNACHNGGTCFNTIGGHTCVCVNGWTGDDCSENIDDCAIAICFNGATCHDRVASFFCECPVGKTGVLFGLILYLCQSKCWEVNKSISRPCFPFAQVCFVIWMMHV